MQSSIGKMNGGLVWLFALGAILLGIGSGFVTQNLGAKISGGVFFGIFAACGFLGVFLTRAKTGIGVVAFLLAAVVAAIVYYTVVASIIAGATTEVAATASNATERLAATAAGNAAGSAVGAFFAIVMFLVSLVAGIGGCVTGGSLRKRMVAA